MGLGGRPHANRALSTGVLSKAKSERTAARRPHTPLLTRKRAAAEA